MRGVSLGVCSKRASSNEGGSSRAPWLFQVPLFGVYEATGLTTEFADFFKTDKALGVVRQEFPRYQMSLTVSKW